MARLVWASTSGSILHGVARLASEDRRAKETLGENATGTVYKFEPVERDVALATFDSVARSAAARSFSIESRDGSRIDFLFPQPSFLSRIFGRPSGPSSVTLDIWFEDEPQPPLDDVVSMSEVSAREFLALVFDDVPDSTLCDFLRMRCEQDR